MSTLILIKNHTAVVCFSIQVDENFYVRTPDYPERKREPVLSYAQDCSKAAHGVTAGSFLCHSRKQSK